MKKAAWISSMVVLMLWNAQPLPADKSASDTISWSSYAEAQNQNQNNQKYFIYFYTDQCPACVQLKKKTFADRMVIDYINANYKPIKVNAAKESKLASRYGIQGVPDLRFVSPKGEDIARWLGYIESKHLLTLLQYIETDSYNKISYKDFVKQQKGQKN